MPASASIRELRGAFPKVKKLLEAEGAVIVSDYGKPKYLLTLYTPSPADPPPKKSYLARLKKLQPRPLSRARSKVLHEENRGNR